MYLCVWKTICTALFNDPTLCNSVLNDSYFCPSTIGESLYYCGFVLTFMETSVIVLADADLDAVAMLLASFTNECCIWKINEVFVQESIEKKFMQLYKERKTEDSMELILRVFRFKEELPSKINKNHTAAISIWTENVTATKSFVMNLMVPLIWINSFGELGPGIMLNVDSGFQMYKYPWEDFKTIETKDLKKPKKTFDLFYDGAWKKPKKGQYFHDKDGASRANATQEDVDSCIQSAKRGFEKWRCVPLSQRKKVLRKIADRICADGKEDLSKLIISQLENPTLYGSSSTIIRDGTVEVLTVRVPKGVIRIIQQKDDKVDFFFRMTNALIAGNSITVESAVENSSPVAEYCDMMINSGIPSGVINLLYFSNIDGRHITIKNNPNFHQINNDRYFETLYTMYTDPKSIWIPLK